jgi:ATP-dependent Clp protease ATP-binding subunit ClpC
MMWQRFTAPTRRAILDAQMEATRLGESVVGTEHLLLGLLCHEDSAAVRVLVRLGSSPERVREEAERRAGRGDGRARKEMELSPLAKRVIDLAYEEARTLENNYVGTEHLLLGILGEGEGLGCRILAYLGIDLSRTRVVAVALQEEDNRRIDEVEVVTLETATGLLHVPVNEIANVRITSTAGVIVEGKWAGTSKPTR